MTLILDGSMGMELESRGFHCRLPLWSAWALIEAPELVREVHADYLRAGCDVLTTATFRCTHHALAREGLGDRTRDLTELAVQLAREAIAEAGGGRWISIAGSMVPLEDCYRPELAPKDEILRREHRRNTSMLADAGVDLLLVETQNSRREAVIATEAALAAGLPVWTCLMPRSATEMFNGDPLLDTAREIAGMGVDAVLVNCCPPDVAKAALSVLREEYPESRLGVYPNDLERKTSPQQFAEWASSIREQADIIGGCCGIGPEHLREAARRLRTMQDSD